MNYGFKTEQEKEMFFDTVFKKDRKYYKGWECVVDCYNSRIYFVKGSFTLHPIEDYKGENWAARCWEDIKAKIDEIEGE